MAPVPSAFHGSSSAPAPVWDAAPGAQGSAKPTAAAPPAADAAGSASQGSEDELPLFAAWLIGAAPKAPTAVDFISQPSAGGPAGVAPRPFWLALPLLCSQPSLEEPEATEGDWVRAPQASFPAPNGAEVIGTPAPKMVRGAAEGFQGSTWGEEVPDHGSDNWLGALGPGMAQGSTTAVGAPPAAPSGGLEMLVAPREISSRSSKWLCCSSFLGAGIGRPFGSLINWRIWLVLKPDELFY